MAQIPSSPEDLARIRADLCPRIEALAAAQVIDLSADDFASDAEGVYGPAYGSLDDMEQVPQPIVDQQRALHTRLNALLGRLGVIGDVAELFDATTKHNVVFLGDPGLMQARVETNTQGEVGVNGGTVARVSFQNVPTGVPATELKRENGSSTEVTEAATLYVMRTEADGDQWVEVAAGQTLYSDPARYGTETAREVSFFYDPRNIEDVPPYLRIRRADPSMASLAIAGTQAWATGLREIHRTIDIIEAAEWPTRQTPGS